MAPPGLREAAWELFKEAVGVQLSVRNAEAGGADHTSGPRRHVLSSAHTRQAECSSDIWVSDDIRWA